MATSALSPNFNTQFFDVVSGVVVPASNYRLFTYASGTVTPQATYTDQAGTVANTNPIILDSSGRCTLWLTDGVEYTFVLQTPSLVTVKTWNDVGGIPLPSSTAYMPLAGGTFTGLVTLSGNATSALNPTPLQQVNSLIAASAAALTTLASAAVPVGAVFDWLTGVPPTKYLELNGSNISRTTYAELFALWGTTYGAGDGSTTFGIPDSRGLFSRGYDNARGVDPGRVLGSDQAQSLLAHTHTHGTGVGSGAGSTTGGGFASINQAGDGSITAAQTASTGGAENRPRNLAYMRIVKALP